MDPTPRLLQQEIDRLNEALEKIRLATWKPGQTLPKLRHEIALILQELKKE